MQEQRNTALDISIFSLVHAWNWVNLGLSQVCCHNCQRSNLEASPACQDPAMVVWWTQTLRSAYLVSYNCYKFSNLLQMRKNNLSGNKLDVDSIQTFSLLMVHANYVFKLSPPSRPQWIRFNPYHQHGSIKSIYIPFCNSSSWFLLWQNNVEIKTITTPPFSSLPVAWLALPFLSSRLEKADCMDTIIYNRACRSIFILVSTVTYWYWVFVWFLWLLRLISIRST